MKIKTLGILAGAIAFAGLSAFGVSSAQAGATFTLAGGYQADFSLINGNTQMQLVLTNSGTGQKQGNTISGIDFAVSGFTLGALTTATATDGLVNPSSTTVTAIGSSILTADGGRWHTGAGPAGDPNELTALGGGQPDHLIIGPSFGGAAGQFDPYVNQVGTYVYSVSNVTTPKWGDSNNQVIFRLGTGPDTTPSSGDCVGDGCNTGSIPEPASLSLLGLGAAGLLLRRRKA